MTKRTILKFAGSLFLALAGQTNAAVFFSDASIGAGNTNYDGQDIVIIGCTVTIDGPHAFSDVLVIDNGILTHSFSSSGLLANPTDLDITGELQTLSGTNFVTLSNSSVVTNTVVVMGTNNNVIYTNGTDYVLEAGGSGTTEIARLPGSSIPDGTTVSMSYEAAGQPVSAGLNLTVVNNVVIEAGSAINADGDGFGPGLGGGAGASLSSDYPFGPPYYYTSGGGGGYGGYGGTSVGGATGGGSYGIVNTPNNLGSGGGAGVGNGGSGGGSIMLAVGGALVADGLISANGSNGVSDGSGGGSGGSIWLSAQNFSGAGSISANGGAGEPFVGGGGSGGRIAILCGTNDFTGTASAHGGAGATPGGAGTVFTQQAADDANGQLVADNGGLSGTNTPLVLLPRVDLTVSGGAIGVFPGSSSTIGNLLIASNSWLLLSSSSTELVVESNMFIQPGGGIRADGQGMLNLGAGGGGGYGGNGGVGTSSADVSAFGSITQPTSAGRGGGVASLVATNGQGGAGGGAIQLSVAGSLILGGNISANGASGTGEGASGGSGGGILVHTVTISGGGTICANGGAASDSSGGGGGGGRIAVYSSTNQLTGRMSAMGGAGANYGGAGTIFTQLGAYFGTYNSVGQVLLDNGGSSGADTPLSTLSSETDLTITNGAVASLNGAEFSARNLVVASNSFIVPPVTALPAGPLQVSLSGNATIQPGGGIVMDSQGSPGSAGTGAGGSTGGNVVDGGGGGYGGAGGTGIGGAPGGQTYGTGIVTAPNLAGSGGGRGTGTSPSNMGGTGGGAIQVTVAGTLALGGKISANGGPGLGFGSGGGSGGSVWLTMTTFTGSGTVSASGGAGESLLGGGGGGGRIAIFAATNEFAGGISAYGGAGFIAGGSGTVFIGTNNDSATGTIILDNGGSEGTNTVLAGLATSADNLIISNGAIATLTSTSVEFENLVIGSNGILTVSSTSPVNCQASILGNASIQTGGILLMDGKGYGGGAGPGSGNTTTSNSIQTGGGGGYGGYGGSSAFGASGGNIYDQPSGTQIGQGSGGGSGLGVSPKNLGGAGGGGVQLIVTGTLSLGGIISANGNPGVGEGSGGGAGGNIYVTASTLSGGGFFSANGGSGNLPYGGGGGGGRISIFCTANTFTGAGSAHGGAGAVFGGAGTFYMQTKTNPVAQLVIDNGGASGTNTPITSLSSGTTDLTITNGAMAVVSGAESVGLHNLFIASNSFLVTALSEQYSLLVSGNATIQPGAAILADGRGSAGATGGGAGRSVTVNGIVTGSGGGNGGPGGASSGGVPGGISYGSLTAPEIPGSGGGTGNGTSPSSLGGAGGGAIHVNVEGMLSLGGRISANGYPGTGQGSGGGSGGSIWLTVAGLSGGGSITANGGSAQLPLGGGGGGGRIEVVFTPYNNRTTNLFTGTISAHGGAGFVAGGAGTIYYFQQQQGAYPQIILDNGGVSGTAAPLPVTQNSDLTISGGADVLLPPAAQQSVHNLLIASNSFLIQTNADAVQWNVTGNATIQAGGGIMVDGIAKVAGGSDGAGSTGTNVGGGGNGGDGGNGADGALGGASYGRIMLPVGLGSPGGAGAATNVAGGGGAVQLTVTGLLQLDGTISANGTSATSGGAGGGSGGNILLTAGKFAGAGVARANGGSGDLPLGGGGGGGRIAVSCNTNQFSGSLIAYGGQGFVGGGAGTVYTTVTGPGQVVVDNGGLAGTNTPILAPVSFALTVTGGAVAQPAPGTSSMIVGSLLVESNASITHLSAADSVNIIVLGNATVQSNASIFADGRGYTGAVRGPGAGQTGTNSEGSGAGYGGQGGASADGAKGGTTYGSSQQPTNWGSAGGLPYGYDPNLSQGGGAILLDVVGTLTVNGKVTANGIPALFEGAGGGAGGSIWLTAGSLAGNGIITANGGAGEPTTGGGGGGGRIALYAATNTFSGAVTAMGATGASSGQNGTLFVSGILPVPQVISQTPSGVLLNATSSVSLLFNSPLDPASVLAANLAVTTPGGLLPSPNMAVSSANPSELDISFPTQSAAGDYAIELGPQIQNIYGAAMSGPYNGTFSITAPAVSLAVAMGLQGTNLGLLWDGANGVTYQIESSTNLIDWQSYGPPIQGSNGTMNVVLPVGAGPQLFFKLAPAN